MTKPGPPPQSPQRGVADAIAEWLISYMAQLLGQPRTAIDDRVAFSRYGLDSSATVGIVGDLSNWLDYEVDAAAAYDHPSIRALAEALASDAALCRTFTQRHGNPGNPPGNLIDREPGDG